MTRFGCDFIEVEVPNWLKHHKKATFLLQCSFIDPNENINNRNRNHISPLFKKYDINEILFGNKLSKRLIIQERTHTCIHGVEKTKFQEIWITLDNLDYPNNEVELYNISNNHIKQTSHIRLCFKNDEITSYLEVAYRGKGDSAMNFFQYLQANGGIVKTAIDYNLNSNLSIEEIGIACHREKKDCYSINGVDELGMPKRIIVELKDLENSLIGVELYQFEMQMAT